MAEVKVICPYCKKEALLVTGDLVYPNRPDLATRRFWLCVKCDAYVGTHLNSPTYKPFGTLANAELRHARREVHKGFDPLWRDNPHLRTKAYGWLANAMGMAKMDCHIGMFNLEICHKAIKLINSKMFTLAQNKNPNKSGDFKCR